MVADSLSADGTWCPVCGATLDLDSWHRSLKNPLLHFICPCCAFHFSYDDEGGSGFSGSKAEIYKSYREIWIRFRMPWLHDDGSKPPNWDPVAQLKRIGFQYPADDGATAAEDDQT